MGSEEHLGPEIWAGKRRLSCHHVVDMKWWRTEIGWWLERSGFAYLIRQLTDCYSWALQQTAENKRTMQAGLQEGFMTLDVTIVLIVVLP